MIVGDYFAYGSNMSSQAIRGRCPAATLVGPAVLSDHRLIFFLEDASWQGGGVAGVVPAPGVQVEGVVYRVTAEDLIALDRYEALDDGDYVRAHATVTLFAGGSRRCWIYLPGRDAETPVVPSQAYVDALLAGAREHGLSPGHVARLAAARSRNRR